ncbi:MAG: hypothetical protein M1830_009197, partial [Pleopsidium flavum]
MVPLFAKTSTSSLSPEERLWTERLLARFCVLTILKTSGSGFANISGLRDLTAFRAWAKFWEGKPGQGLTALEGPSAEFGIYRRHIWKAYYDALSVILQQRLLYEPPLNALAEKPEYSTAVRMLQRVELMRVETSYEGLLLKEMRFPKADEANEEVEYWVEQVMGNWRVFCGPSWSDKELGEGGQEAVGRNVLDILYRAATKTFHSTPVLRHLFTVHTSLAEFDIAFRAFDTYIQIVTKGRARAEKSGDPESNLDNDETALRTAAEGIRVLCRFGSRREAEKARDIGITLEQWLKHHHADSPSKPTINGDGPGMAAPRQTLKTSVSPTGPAIAYRTIGISQAHWAEMTYEASDRAEIQAKARQNLQKSLAPEFADSEDLETLFALGLLSAKTRDLSSAVEIVKHALSSNSQGSAPMSPGGALADIRPLADMIPQQNSFIRERKLIPFWHLLALLMTARQEWATAVRSCAAAFEQFPDQSCLFGSDEALGVIEKESYPGSAENASKSGDTHGATRGVVDSMDEFEKQGIIEIKMTQLSLMEVLEGPEVAVNASDELLGLFTRLFRDLKVLVPQKPQSEAMPPPQSSGGTVRTIRGSLFGRPKTSRTSVHKPDTSVASTAAPGTAAPTLFRPSSDATAAPIIQVTNEDGEMPQTEHQHHHRLFHRDVGHAGQRFHKRTGSLNSKKSFGSFRRKRDTSSSTSTAAKGSYQTSVQEEDENPRVGISEQVPTPHYVDSDEGQRTGYSTSASPPADAVGVAVSPEIPPPAPSPSEGHDESSNATQPLTRIAHNLHRGKQPPPIAHKRQTPNQDVRLPTISPDSSSTQPGPRFPKARERRYALSLLVKVWLLIAGLYRRASMYDDARGAWDEAFTHVEQIEAEVAIQSPSSSRAFEEHGWGGCKSVEELWGDVWAERGNLSQALACPQEALVHFERALDHCLDHPSATVGLSNILLDVYTQTIPPQPTISTTSQPLNLMPDSTSTEQSPSQFPNSTSPGLTNAPPLGLPHGSAPHSPPSRPRPSSTHRKNPEHLDRLAARDRAYGLLSSLTKLGSGWDYSEAWFALARAYEEGAQLEKAREVLWWCVELEDTRPVRAWENVNVGG